MKKLILSAVALSTLTVSFAQNKDVEKLQKALVKNDASIADAKKASTAAPWIERADIFIDMANAYTKNLIPGFGLTQIQETIGAPSSSNEVEYKGVTYMQHSYPEFDVYTNPEQNTISFWMVKEAPVEGALTKAFESLEKAHSLSSKEFEGTGKGSVAASRLVAAYQADGMAFYNMGEGDKAGELFEKSFEVGELTGTFDTLYLYYAGIAYFEGQDFAAAVPALEKVLNAGSDQDGQLYYYLAESYIKEGNTDKAITVLEDGFNKYPADETIMGTLINAYMAAKKDPSQIVTLVQKAQELSPKNTTLYMVESSIYAEMGDNAKAYVVLEKIMNDIDPNFFSAYYNYAIMKILEAQEIRKQADALDLNDVKGYEAKMDEIVAIQTDAIEKLEKAHEIDKANKDVIDVLKQLYFPRREDEGSKARYEYFEGLANAQ